MRVKKSCWKPKRNRLVLRVRSQTDWSQPAPLAFEHVDCDANRLAKRFPTNAAGSLSGENFSEPWIDNEERRIDRKEILRVDRSDDEFLACTWPQLAIELTTEGKDRLVEPGFRFAVISPEGRNASNGAPARADEFPEGLEFSPGELDGTTVDFDDVLAVARRC